MRNEASKPPAMAGCRRPLLAALSVLLLGASLGARADEADARRLLAAMSDYLAAQATLSVDFDATLEVVTEDAQKLALASSGSVVLHRPNRIRATRRGGFSDIAFIFDGETLTLLGKNLNLYAQLDLPGSIDDLIDELRHEYGRPLPAADLLLGHPYEELMRDVTDVKDLGAGVIGAVECDHLAFRKPEVDWQIWITQGERPLPCRYVITSKGINGQPQYTLEFRGWRTGGAAAAADFEFENTTNARKVDLEALRKDAGELPPHFVIAEPK